MEYVQESSDADINIEIHTPVLLSTEKPTRRTFSQEQLLTLLHNKLGSVCQGYKVRRIFNNYPQVRDLRNKHMELIQFAIHLCKIKKTIFGNLNVKKHIKKVEIQTIKELNDVKLQFNILVDNLFNESNTQWITETLKNVKPFVYESQIKQKIEKFDMDLCLLEDDETPPQPKNGVLSPMNAQHIKTYLSPTQSSKGKQKKHDQSHSIYVSPYNDQHIYFDGLEGPVSRSQSSVGTFSQLPATLSPGQNR